MTAGTRQPRVLVRGVTPSSAESQWWWACDGCSTSFYEWWLLDAGRIHDAARTHARRCLPLRYALLVHAIRVEADRCRTNADLHDARVYGQESVVLGWITGSASTWRVAAVGLDGLVREATR